MESIITDFHFLRPMWFTALIPAFMLYIALKFISTRQSGWQAVIPAHLYQHMVIGKSHKQKKPTLWLLALAWIIAILALAGPTWERLPQPVYQLKMGHVIVMDMSLSMRATDITPDRLTRAKYKAIDLVNKIGEGEMGLVAYAGDAFVVSPLTHDAANITSLLPSLSPEIMPVPGSDPLLGIQTAAELLTNAGYSKGMIYWITDGINARQQQELQEYVADLPFTLNALAVGTNDGAPIRQTNGELLKDNSGAIVIPKLNASAINAVVRSSGGKFSEITTNDNDINALSSLSLLDKESESQENDSDNLGDQWEEVGPYLVIVLLPIAAFGFRRGLIFILVAALYLPMGTAPVRAQEQPNSDAHLVESSDAVAWWKKPFLNTNQEGLASYKNNAFDKAAQKFNDPAWQGAAYYKAGDYQKALNAYQQVQGIDGLYNQGNALAHLGKLDEAIAKYDEVLRQDPNHEDAAANKAVLEQMKQQQEQQQQQDQNNENNNSDQNQSNQDNADRSDNENGQNESSQNNDQSNENNEQQDSSQQQNNNQANENDNSGAQQQNQQEQLPSDPSSDNDSEQSGSASGSENQPEDSDENNENNMALQPTTGEMTDAQKEQQQRMDNLMRRVPDDPAFLLKRKMQLEAQKRQRQRMPSDRSDW